MEPEMIIFPPDTVFFPEQPDNVPVETTADGKTLYKLRRPFAYIWLAPDDFRRCLLVPAGFENDGASVPRIVWSISGMQQDGEHRAAAIIHDFLYEYQGAIPVGSYLREDDDGWNPVIADWKRKHADRMFGRIMREYTVPRQRRRMAYRAVRVGGWTAWNT
jgi:hypothetical protein